MYKITVDDILLYNPLDKDYFLINAKLEQELNTSGTLSLTIPQANPSYGLAKLMKSEVKLYEDDELIFCGRPYAPSYDLYKDNELTIEGELAYLNDSVYSPFSYSGNVANFFTSLINNHNSQVDDRRKFVVGNITVTNSTEEGNITRSSEDYENTWSIIKEKLIDKIGGYLHIRRVDNVRYIDYLDDLNFVNNQPVTQAINLVDAKKNYSADDLATVILPLGEKSEDEDGNVSYVNLQELTGSMYVESEEGIEKYGRIIKVVHHDDITLPANLLRVAKKDLGDAIGVTQSISLTAADLKKAGYEYDNFRVGTYVDVNVCNLDIDERMLIRKLSIDLLNPASNKLSIGVERNTLTAENYKTTTKLEESIVQVNKDNVERVVNAALQTIRQVESMITANSEQLQSTFSVQYYDKNNVDNLLSSISTQITQTANAITFAFNQYQEHQNDINDSNEATFKEINRYIRFEDGAIILGESGNPLILRETNERISFLESGVEVAYINNSQLYITNVEVLNSLRLGSFAFIPRNNGNLSFKKVK